MDLAVTAAEHTAVTAAEHTAVTAAEDSRSTPPAGTRRRATRRALQVLSAGLSARARVAGRVGEEAADVVAAGEADES